jgi:hypothetical protein
VPPRIDDLLRAAILSLPAKPPDTATREAKQNYSQNASKAIAQACAEELRQRGLETARPGGPGVVGTSGAERRMAGGIGAKRVDVTWATEESGLLFAISVKTINFADRRGRHFQKNLTNRRGDMLMEAVTLHRRFPYAVLAGFFFLDKGAAADGTAQRKTTFINAHQRFRIFTGRPDPAARDEQYERLYIILLDTDPASPGLTAYAVGDAATPVLMDAAFDDLMRLVAERNPDFYEYDAGNLRRVDS